MGRKGAVRDGTISTTGSGSVGGVISRRYVYISSLFVFLASPQPRSFSRDLRLFKLANRSLQGRQVEEDPGDFGTQGRTHRVKKDVIEKGRKSQSAARNGVMHTRMLIFS